MTRIDERTGSRGAGASWMTDIAISGAGLLLALTLILPFA